jgi:hypothetical protein
MNHQHTATLRGLALLTALESGADLSTLHHANLDSCSLRLLCSASTIIN